MCTRTSSGPSSGRWPRSQKRCLEPTSGSLYLLTDFPPGPLRSSAASAWIRSAGPRVPPAWDHQRLPFHTGGLKPVPPLPASRPVRAPRARHGAGGPGWPCVPPSGATHRPAQLRDPGNRALRQGDASRAKILPRGKRTGCCRLLSFYPKGSLEAREFSRLRARGNPQIFRRLAFSTADAEPRRGARCSSWRPAHDRPPAPRWVTSQAGSGTWMRGRMAYAASEVGFSCMSRSSA